jgi:hypothetical protein
MSRHGRPNILAGQGRRKRKKISDTKNPIYQPIFNISRQFVPWQEVRASLRRRLSKASSSKALNLVPGRLLILK